MPCYVYILESERTKQYYVGVTNDLDRRLDEHNRGNNISTRHRGPWKRIYIEEYSTSVEAKKRETEIKSKKRRAYIESLVQTEQSTNHGCVV